MDVLISGNDNVLSMMYLMEADIAPSINELRSHIGQQKFRDMGEKLLSDAIASSVDLRPSVFNHAVATKEKLLVYNTLYNAEAWFSFNEYAALQGKMPPSAETRQELLENGFAVPKDMDERGNYGRWRVMMRELRDHLSLNITTTLKCNAHCPYCYESGVKAVDFDESKLEALIDFIKQRKEDPPLKLNWFGGEPLLNTQLIDKIIKRVGECGFRYESHIITNGSLITKRMLTKFKRWHVQSVQITLDGTEKNYTEKKGYPASFKEPFSRVLDHIEWVATAGIHVDIRLNTDRDNLRDMIDLVYLLQSRFDGVENVVYYPAFLTGTNSKLTEREKVDYIKAIFGGLANPRKLSVTTRMYSAPRNVPCMRNDPRSFSVDVYGRVYSCEHLVGRPKESLGTLKRLPNKVNEARAEEELRNECQTCVFLPKCMGGCASNLTTGDVACMIGRYIIMAYMEYMCEQNGSKIIPLDSLDLSSYTESEKSEKEISLDGIHNRLMRLETTVKMQNELLESFGRQFANKQVSSGIAPEKLDTLTELLRLDLANRLLDDMENTIIATTEEHQKTTKSAEILKAKTVKTSKKSKENKIKEKR